MHCVGRIVLLFITRTDKMCGLLHDIVKAFGSPKWFNSIPSDKALTTFTLCYIDKILHVYVVTVHLVGGILDEVQYNILD